MAAVVVEDEASRERSKAKTLINNRCKYSPNPTFGNTFTSFLCFPEL
jgi:hypothetical protein